MPFKTDHIHPFNSKWADVPVVYGMLTTDGTVIYVGQASSMKRRHDEHCCDTAHLMHRYKPAHVVVEIIHDQVARNARERELILEYNPPCNQRL